MCTHLLFYKIYTRQQKCALKRQVETWKARRSFYKRMKERQTDKFPYLLQKLRPSRRLGLKCQFKYLKLNRRMCQSSEWPRPKSPRDTKLSVVKNTYLKLHQTLGVQQLRHYKYHVSRHFSGPRFPSNIMKMLYIFEMKIQEGEINLFLFHFILMTPCKESSLLDEKASAHVAAIEVLKLEEVIMHIHKAENYRAK